MKKAFIIFSVGLIALVVIYFLFFKTDAINYTKYEIRTEYVKRTA